MTKSLPSILIRPNRLRRGAGGKGFRELLVCDLPRCLNPLKQHAALLSLLTHLQLVNPFPQQKDGGEDEKRGEIH